MYVKSGNDYEYHDIDIVGAFSKYTADVKKKIGKAVRKRGNELLDDIVNGSPVRKELPRHSKRRFDIHPGEYKRSWVKTMKKTETGVRVVVHNKMYGLPHLQELPHRTGGSADETYPKGSNGAVGAIRAANKKFSDRLNKDIEDILNE